VDGFRSDDVSPPRGASYMSLFGKSCGVLEQAVYNREETTDPVWSPLRPVLVGAASNTPDELPN